MRKLFLFTAAVLAMGSSQIKATDHIVNGGFESTDAATLLSKVNYEVNQPAGWTLNYTTALLNATGNWDQAIISQGYKDNGNTSLGVTIPEGSNFFFVRMRWEANAMALSQTKNLSAGEYLLSFSAFAPEGATYPSKLAIVAGTDTLSKLDLTATTWTKFTAGFTLTSAADVKIVFDLKHTSTAKQQTFYLDNVILSDDPVAIFNDELKILCQTVNGLNFQEKYPLGYSKKLTDLVTDITNNVIDKVTDLATLKATYANLDSIYQECLTSADVYTKLSNLDNDAYVEWNVTHTYVTGVPALQAAEEAANAVLIGENSLKSDFEQAITDLTAAIRAYKLSEVSFATKTAPIDLTWLIDTPTFTKDGGDVATSADAVQGAWVNGNNVTSKSSIDVKLNTVTGYNCWNSWADAWQGTMDLYQKLTNLPIGLYTVSAKHVSNGNASTTTHVYATTVAGTKSSPICNNIYDGTAFTTEAQWVTYQTDTILVASDGALRIGITSTGEGTKAGWFCVTDFKLNYYGAQAVLDEYKKSLAAKIEGAKTLATKEMLVSETAAINSAITAAETADASTAAAIEATLATLNVAIAEADTAALAMSTFKAGSYATLVAQSTDAGGSTGLAGFVNDQIEAVDAALVAADATSEVYTSFGKKLAIAISYGKAQIAASAAAQLHDDIAGLLIDVQEHYDALSLTADTTALKTYTTELTAYNTFAALYATNIVLATDEATYSLEARNAFDTTMKGIVADIASASDLPLATTKLHTAVGTLKSTGVQPGDDLTAKWIVNSETTATGNSDAMTGWSITKTDGNTFSATGQHWSADTSRRYLDSWNGTVGLLQYIATQSIKGLSNGTYKMKCAVRSSGAGAVFYALTGDDTLKVEIPNNADTAGSIWADSEEGSPEKSAHGGVGYGWNWVTLDNINVGANELVFGVTTKSDFIHSTWTGTWFSATDFKLFYVSADYTKTGGVSIDEVSSDASTALQAYAENGYIVVPGVTNFEVTTIAGAAVNAKAQLAPGIYVVKAAGKVAKVAVK